MQTTKTFNQWLSESEVEADLRSHVQHLFMKYKGYRLALESGDLFHDVVVKLAHHDHPVESRSALFGLVSMTALNRLRDLGRKQSFRGSFFSKPMPTRLRPLPGSTMESVACKDHSPFEQAALRDEMEMIAKAAQDQQLESLFQTLIDLSARDESTSSANIARTLDLPPNQVKQSLQKLRSIAREMH